LLSFLISSLRFSSPSSLRHLVSFFNRFFVILVDTNTLIRPPYPINRSLF
jgi:hypothetical protein